MSPTAPVTRRPSASHRSTVIQATRDGAIAEPMEDPALKMPIPKARWRAGNHSATAFAAAGQLPGSAKPRRNRKAPKRPFADGKCMKHLSRRPRKDEYAEPELRSKPVNYVAGAGVHDGVGEQKERENVRVVLLIQMKLAADVDRDHRQGGPVEVVDHGREQEHPRDHPPQFRNLHSGLNECKPEVF